MNPQINVSHTQNTQAKSPLDMNIHIILCNDGAQLTNAVTREVKGHIL